MIDAAEDISNRDGARLLSFRGMLSKAGGVDASAASKDFDYECGTVVMPFSSGTTGAPKGVELTHQNLVANACQLIYSKGFEFAPFPTGNS